MTIILIALCAYLIGSIPFGLIITRAMGMGDVRQIGSGNIGATNVLRTGNKGAAIATLLLDMSKGLIAVVLCNHYDPQYSGIALIFVILGHCFSFWLKFKGGKGVATYIGAIFGLYWVLGVIAICIWLGVAISKRISSLAALVMVIMMILMGFIFTPFYILPIAISAVIVIYQHRANIARLRAGTEPKIGKKDPQ